MRIITQKQRWNDFTRYILMTDDCCGTVQVDIPTARDKHDTANIYALWVNRNSRRQGIATKLLATAEQVARNANCIYTTLYWSKKDTPIEILEWYKRKGYEKTSSFCDIVVWLKKGLLNKNHLRQ